MSDISGLDTRMRMPGLATGMDTDAMIKKMMAAENIKMDKMKQNRQYVQWRQDIYRDIIKDFRDLRSSFLMIESPADTNVIKSGSYSGSSITVSDNNNVSSSNVTATALPGAVNGVTKLTVTQIAKSATLSGGKLGNNTVDTGVETEWNDKTLTFDINGKPFTTAEIKGVTDSTNLEIKINDAINANDTLKGKVKATVKDGKVTFNVLTSDSVKITGETYKTGTTKMDTIKGMELNPTTSTKLSDIDPKFGDKFPSGQDFYIKQSGKVSSKITITKDDTIQDVMSKIYSAQSKNGDKNSTLNSDLQISFSDLTKNLTIKTRDTGSAQSLQITSDEAGSTPVDLSVLGLTKDVQRGQDAKVSIIPPGGTTPIEVIRSTNNFAIDNVNYNLVKDPNGTAYDVTLTAKADSKSSFDKIKAFIDKYNALVQKVSDKLQEKKEYSYKPLTDDQKKDMKEDQIKTWEDKAKQGILKNDGDLQAVLFDMRNAFATGVKAAGISLKEIGIDTYGSFEAATKPGQLKIDEAKLKSALETRGDQVMKIFISSAPSTVPTEVQDEYKSKYGDKWQKHYEFDNSGVFQRISSIINDSAVKFDGILLKKAGYKGTLSESDNTITKQLTDQDKSINEMNKKLATKQERYYQMFAKLETAMNQLNAQQSWLTQQLGGGK